MNKNSVVFSLISLAALMAVIAVSIFFLYSSSYRRKGDGAPVSSYKLMRAVPLDAALILCSSSTEEAVSTLTNKSLILNNLFNNSSGKGFNDFLLKLKTSEVKAGNSCETMVSMHYSGDFVPLMIVDAGSSFKDTSAYVKSIIDAAAFSGLSSRFLYPSSISGAKPAGRQILLVSPSETLLSASQRHFEAEISILDKASFSAAAQYSNGRDAVFISHDYAGKLLRAGSLQAYAGYSGFLSSLSEWTVLEVKPSKAGNIFLKGRTFSSSGFSFFRNVLSSSAAGLSKFSEILPDSTISAVSICTDDILNYIDSYEKFIDASGKLDKYRQYSKLLKEKSGIEPQKWAESLDIKETCKASVIAKGKEHDLLLVRTAKEDASVLLKGTDFSMLKDAKGKLIPFAYKGFASAVFGNFMSLEDESSCILINDWIIIGNESSLLAFAERGAESKNLKTFFAGSNLEGRLPDKKVNAVALKIKARPSESLLMAANGSEFSLYIDKFQDQAEQALESNEFLVEIPQGPFKIKNSGTGRTNFFSQAPNLALSLKEEDGKGIWSIPFSSRICGAAVDIDYFENGKRQILFAAGSGLYLIDRLGRFVSPFPVSLGKEALLGPAVYDFIGGYSIMILHKDNSLGLYDLKGKKIKDWKDIMPAERIKSLPELLIVKDKMYWLVRTSACSLIYNINGGEPLTKAEDNKRIRPDSPIQVNEGEVSATCLDGKIRNIKLN